MSMTGGEGPEPESYAPEIDPEELADYHAEIDAMLGATPTGPTNGHQIRVDSRPEVRMGKDMHRVVAEVSTAIALDPLVYQRANELVTVVGSPKIVDGVPVAPGTPIIRPLNQSALILRLTRHVKIVAPKKPNAKAIRMAEMGGAPPKPEWSEILPPPVLTAGMLHAGDWEDIRHLRGVSETPFLRPDGTVCQVPGYDDATGYLYAPSVVYPEIPAEPSQDAARAALELLIDVFREFPHVSGAARLVPIAAILTLLARPAIDGAIPGFVFDAATRGSGKTLQAHAISLIALGRFASPCTFPEADEELEKVLAAYAIAGSRIILLDNITRPFGGAPLDKALTARGEVDLRVLGASEMRRLAWNAIVLASGNNVSLPEDTTRRVLVSRLESPLENPEDRTDVRHLPTVCLAARGELVAAALTVLRAYTCHGSPHTGSKAWGSFEEWSRLIPHALQFAGGDDVMEARPRGALASGDELGALAVILRELPRLSAEPMTAKAIVQTLWPASRDHDAAPDGWDDLRDAIEALLTRHRPGMTPTAKSVSEALRRKAARVLGGAKLDAVNAHNNVRAWRVLKA